MRLLVHSNNARKSSARLTCNIWAGQEGSRAPFEKA